MSWHLFKDRRTRARAHWAIVLIGLAIAGTMSFVEPSVMPEPWSREAVFVALFGAAMWSMGWLTGSSDR